MKPKRIKSGKDKGKYRTEDGLVLTLTQLKQMRSWYDKNIRSKSKDPSVKKW